MSAPAQRRSRLAAFASIVPLVYGIVFAGYAFVAESVTHTVISSDGESMTSKSIAEAGDGSGVVLALAPFAAAVFVAILLWLARKEHDSAPLWMAWVFSGAIALAGLASVTSIGRYLLLPAVLMLGATYATHALVIRTRS